MKHLKTIYSIGLQSLSFLDIMLTKIPIWGYVKSNSTIKQKAERG